MPKMGKNMVPSVGGRKENGKYSREDKDGNFERGTKCEPPHKAQRKGLSNFLFPKGERGTWRGKLDPRTMGTTGAVSKEGTQKKGRAGRERIRVEFWEERTFDKKMSSIIKKKEI